MVIVMASATVLNNVYAPSMTHAPNNTSAYVTYPSTNHMIFSHDLKLESPLEPPHHPHCIHDTTPPEDQSYPHTPLTLILINPSPSH